MVLQKIFLEKFQHLNSYDQQVLVSKDVKKLVAKTKFLDEFDFLVGTKII